MIHLSSAPMDSKYKLVLSATRPTGERGCAQSHPPGGGPALPGPSPLLSVEGAFHGWSAWAPGFGEALLPNSLQSPIALLTNKTTLKASDKFFQDLLSVFILLSLSMSASSGATGLTASPASSFALSSCDYLLSLFFQNVLPYLL